MTEDEKDLEILLLRQQLRIVERKKISRLPIPKWQKVPLAVLAVRLKERSSNSTEALKRFKCSCSNRTRYCAGLATWCVGSGRSKGKGNQVDHPSILVGEVDPASGKGQSGAGFREVGR